MRRPLATLVGSVSVAAAVTALAPAAAGAATIATNLPCYVETQPMIIGGTGWGPGTGWSVQADQIFDAGVADGAGNWVSSTETAPVVPAITTRPQTVTLTGAQDGVTVATATFKVVNFLVRPRDDNGKPKGKTSWGFSGFLPGKRIYVHVRRGSKTYTEAAGRGDGTCGTLRTRMSRLPAVPRSKVRAGTYKVFVDNRRKFSKGGRQYAAAITIRRTFSR